MAGRGGRLAPGRLPGRLATACRRMGRPQRVQECRSQPLNRSKSMKCRATDRRIALGLLHPADRGPIYELSRLNKKPVSGFVVGPGGLDSRLGVFAVG